METAARSTRHAPPSPTLLPSATDNLWPPNSHKAPPPHWYTPASNPHPCNTPESNPLAATAHCTTSPCHTNLPSAPDDSLPCPHRHAQSHIRDSWPNYRPAAIDCSSPGSRPCKTPTPSRWWGWHQPRHPACPPS